MAYAAGTAIKITDTIRDKDDNLLDPTSIKITIYDPDDTVKVDAEDMSKVSTGIYEYDWQSDDNDGVGTYKVKTVAVSAGFTSTKVIERAFYLK
jgi:hypothetical protein